MGYDHQQPAWDFEVPANYVLLNAHGNMAKDGESVSEMLNDATASRFVAVDPDKLPILSITDGKRVLHHPVGTPRLVKDRP